MFVISSFRSLKCAAFGAAFGAMGVMAGATHADTVLDFEGLVHGQIVDNEYVGLGVTVSANNPHRPNPDWAVAFDTQRDPGAVNWKDVDLLGPPANGASWALGNIKDTALGNILMLNINNKDADDDGIADNPINEGKRPSGSIFFDFDTSVKNFGFDIVDVDSANEWANGAVNFYKDGTLKASVSWASFLTNDGNPWYDPTIEVGNNSANRIAAITAEQLSNYFGISLSNFNGVEVVMGGSGGLDNISVRSAPLPAASLMGLSLLGTLGLGTLVRRRQRNVMP